MVSLFITFQIAMFVTVQKISDANNNSIDSLVFFVRLVLPIKYCIIGHIHGRVVTIACSVYMGAIIVAVAATIAQCICPITLLYTAN